MKMPFSSGQPETACGAGSTLANTTHVRAWLPGLLRELGVDSLLDAPCGDFNWMAATDLSRVDYVGADLDPEHCDRARWKASEPGHGPRRKTILRLDLVSDRLPRADVMLCRDFLQHLPDAQASRVLANFVTSGTEWLLATSHDCLVNTDIPAAGMFRPLDLMAAPFNLPAPRREIGDQPGSGRILGLWRRDDLEHLR